MKRFFALLGASMLVASHAHAGPTPSYPAANALAGTETTTFLQPGPLLGSTVRVTSAQIAAYASTSLGGVVLPHVPTTAALAALSTVKTTAIVRDGFYVAGDAPAVVYIAGSAGCSLNGGAGDSGSQISSSNGKCWLASFSSSPFDITEWGAKCDGVTDDAGDITAALTFAGIVAPSSVTLPPGRVCAFGSTLVVPLNVTLQGQGPRSGGLKPKTINISPMIHLADDAANVESLFIFANAAGVNTSGAAIDSVAAHYNRVEDVQIAGPCLGLDISGNTQWVNRVVVNQYQGTGCGGMRVGHLTTLGQTTDLSILETTLASDPGTPADYDLEIQDAGGLLMHHQSNIFGTIGTLFKPGLNQVIEWATISDSFLGDTTSGDDVVFDTADATGVIKGLQCDDCWFGSAGIMGILVQNTAGGTISGLNFLAPRVFGANGNGADILAGTNVNFDTPHFCGNGVTTAASNLNFGTGVTTFAVRNGEIGGACDGVPLGAHLALGINFDGSNSGGIVTGNDFTGSPTPISGASTLTNSIVENNLGIVAAGTSVSIGASPFTHIAGAQPETDYISGGTVSNVATSGVTACAGSPCTVSLGPNESLTVTYSGAPTINRVLH